MKITGRDLAEQLGWTMKNQSKLFGTAVAVVNLYEEYEIKEPVYSIKLPKLRTTDNEPQYLSRRKSGGSWFASRADTNIKQAFTKAELLQVPEEYRQYAKKSLIGVAPSLDLDVDLKKPEKKYNVIAFKGISGRVSTNFWYRTSDGRLDTISKSGNGDADQQWTDEQIADYGLEGYEKIEVKDYE